jgi:hypothetical protein
MGPLHFRLARFNFFCNENSINFTIAQAAKYTKIAARVASFAFHAV